MPAVRPSTIYPPVLPVLRANFPNRSLSNGSLETGISWHNTGASKLVFPPEVSVRRWWPANINWPTTYNHAEKEHDINNDYIVTPAVRMVFHLVDINGNSVQEMWNYPLVFSGLKMYWLTGGVSNYGTKTVIDAATACYGIKGIASASGGANFTLELPETVVFMDSGGIRVAGWYWDFIGGGP